MGEGMIDRSKASGESVAAIDLKELESLTWIKTNGETSWSGTQDIKTLIAEYRRLLVALGDILDISEHENSEHNWCIPYRNLKLVHGEAESALTETRKVIKDK